MPYHQYLDLTDIKTDYDDRVLFLRDVESAFMEQPSDVRKLFHNDAGEWLEAVHGGLMEQEAALKTPPAEPQKPLEKASTLPQVNPAE